MSWHQSFKDFWNDPNITGGGLALAGTNKEKENMPVPPTPVIDLTGWRNHFKVCRVEGLPATHEELYPFKNGDDVLVLGEIVHIPGHVAIALNDGRVVWAYDQCWFRPLTEEEV